MTLSERPFSALPHEDIEDTASTALSGRLVFRRRQLRLVHERMSEAETKSEKFRSAQNGTSSETANLDGVDPQT
ncbi:MAG: hypothetical protein AAF674_20765 [Pseudomonadota bacterium]